MPLIIFLNTQKIILVLGFSIQKMAASDHSEVSAYALDLKKNLGSHFRNIKTLEKKQIILVQFFFTSREDNAWRKLPFLNPNQCRVFGLSKVRRGADLAHTVSLPIMASFFHPIQPKIVSNDSWHLYLYLNDLIIILYSMFFHKKTAK